MTNESKTLECRRSPPAPAHLPPATPSAEKTGTTSLPTLRNLFRNEYTRAYMQHLANWASDHDSSLHFQGKLGVMASSNGDDIPKLNSPVRCVLTYTHHPQVRKNIVIRLFGPRVAGSRYIMVVRSGSGWMSARDFFNKEHFVMLRAKASSQAFEEIWRKERRTDESAKRRMIRARKPGSPHRARLREAEEQNSISVAPVFHQFLRLPPEIQDMIWVTASGLTGMFRPCRHRTSGVHSPYLHENFYPKPDSNITVPTMLRVCKPLYEHMAPWIYRTTNFHFELTGFTNFLWLSGPVNRANLRRVAFKFSSTALLHCIRWLCPDPVFGLFDPPAHTSPAALQYFWRCEIKDLTREVHLHTLTLDLQDVDPQHVPMMVRILRQAFGSVKYVRFQQSGKDLPKDHWRLQALLEKKSWRAMCGEWFEAHREMEGYMSNDRRRISRVDLEKMMDAEGDFFDIIDDVQDVQVP